MEPNSFESSPLTPDPQSDTPDLNGLTADVESPLPHAAESAPPAAEPSAPEPQGVAFEPESSVPELSHSALDSELSTPDSELSMSKVTPSGPELNGVASDSEPSNSEPSDLDSEASNSEPSDLDSEPSRPDATSSAIPSDAITPDRAIAPLDLAPTPSPTASPHQQGRLWLPVLVLNLLVVGGVTARVFSDPTVGNLQPYTFPETVDLDGWTLAESEAIQPVEKPEYEGSSYRAGRHYRYRQGRDRLDIEIRYVTETTGGVDLFTREHERFINKAEGEEIVARIRQSPETGAFAEVTYDGYAYISTCMNPRGLSTVSPEQFQRNQELYDTVLGRVVPWVLGRDRWRDDRCLWTLMYAPLGDDPEQTQAQLEAAWQDWFQTWDNQFPPL